MKGTVITHRGGSFGRGKLYAAVIVGETKTQWKACMLDDDGKETSKEIRLTKRTMTEVGRHGTYWHTMPADYDLTAELAEDRARQDAVAAERAEKQAQWERKVSNIKSVVKLTGWVSEELGLAKAEGITPRNGLVVMVYTAEQRESLYGAPGVTVSITAYHKTEYGVSGGSTTVNGPDVETALAAYLATWHWD